MRKSLLIFLSLFSFSALAKLNVLCKSNEYKFEFSLHKTDDITVNVFKKKNKIVYCNYKVESFEMSKNSIVDDELYRIVLIGCTPIFDKEAQKLTFQEKGFFKVNSTKKIVYAYIQKNQHPLNCSIP